MPDVPRASSPLVLSTFYSQEHKETLEQVCCPACGAADSVPYRRAHDRLFGRAGKYQVVRCRTCGMMYTNPRPTFESLGRHYPDDYFCYMPLELVGGWRQRMFGRAVQNVSRRRLDDIETATGRLGPSQRVCDVGCAYGELLQHMKQERGCDVIGVDFNADVVARCQARGVPALAGTLESARFPDGSFDVVTMTEYLEHEGRPRDVLAECRRVTKPGGFVAIEVPLITSGVARFFGNHWSQLDLPRHLMFFTPATIERMLAQAGYELVSIHKHPGSIAMSLLHVFGYEKVGRFTTWDAIALVLTSLLLAPIAPHCPEFMMVLARATAPRALLPAPARTELADARSSQPIEQSIASPGSS